MDDCWGDFGGRRISFGVRLASLPRRREVPCALTEAIQVTRLAPFQGPSKRGASVADPGCQMVRIATAVNRGSRGAACKSRQRCAPPHADFESKPGGIRGIWRGIRRYELSFSGGLRPLIWPNKGMFASGLEGAGRVKITQVDFWQCVINGLANSCLGCNRTKNTLPVAKSRLQWHPQLHEPAL